MHRTLTIVSGFGFCDVNTMTNFVNMVRRHFSGNTVLQEGIASSILHVHDTALVKVRHFQDWYIEGANCLDLLLFVFLKVVEMSNIRLIRNNENRFVRKQRAQIVKKRYLQGSEMVNILKCRWPR